MKDGPRVEICTGLPELHRRRAAQLLYVAFRQKLEPFLCSEKHGRAILEESITPELSIIAVREKALVGLVGMRYGGRKFLEFQVSSFAREFGRFGGLVRFAILEHSFGHRSKAPLWIDWMAVHPPLQRRGIGRRLLEAVCDFAQANGYSSVGLEVVDTSADARRLYERMGFVAIRTRRLPCLSRLLGYSAVITMIREVA